MGKRYGIGPWWRALAALALLVATSARAAAQNDGRDEARAYARLSAGVLRLGDTGTLSVTVENARDARILKLPTVEGLTFGKPGRPSTHQSSGFVNGRVYSEFSMSWTLTIRPAAEGDYEIPPISLEVGGKTLETQPLHLTVAVDITGEDFGYLEIRPSKTRIVDGQPFTIELTFGWDASEDVNFAELNLPWWDSLPGAIEIEGAAAAGKNQASGILVNREIEVSAEQLEPRERGGRRFLALRLTKSYLATRSGTLEFPTSFFEFGRRVRQVSFFDTRPVVRESHFVQAVPFTIEVVSLPSEGQPLDFSGAVGTIGARASADARDVRVGDSIKLTVEWSGQGNLQFFRPPDPAALDAFRGFRVYGSTEEKSFERRKVTYDIAPLSTEVQSIPAVPLTVFDPEQSRYTSVSTTPIPIRVRPLEKSAGLGEAEKHFEGDIEDIDMGPIAGGPGSARAASQDRFLAVALLGVPALGLLARQRARRRSGDPAAPLARRRRRAPKELARALARSAGPADDLPALLEFLGARTREQASAWQGRDFVLWAGERAPALAPELCARARELALALEAAVYGGAAPVERGRLLALARELVEAGL